jgi:hypothetical protein
MDVMRWEGTIEVDLEGGRKTDRTIASWDTMTACIKGFTMWRDGFGFEVGAIEPGCSPSERYMYETGEC